MLIFCDGYGEQYLLSKSTFNATFFVMIALFIALYVLRSIGLFVMAKKSGEKFAFLSCLPFVWVYIASKLVVDQPIFGKVTKWKPLIVVLIFSFAEIITITIAIIMYLPLIGFYLQGGTVYIETSERFVPVGSIVYQLNPLFYTSPAINVSYVYNPSFVYFMSVINYISMFISLFGYIIVLTVYIDLFKKYYPNHYVLASFLSLLGFFGIFVFARRNSAPVNFNDYMKNRYKTFMQGQNNTFNNNQDFYNNRNNNNSNEPFSNFNNNNYNENFNNRNSNNSTNNEPFEEFSDKNGDKR